MLKQPPPRSCPKTTSTLPQGEGGKALWKTGKLVNMRRVTASMIGMLFCATAAMAAPAPTPVTTEQFVARCKNDASFCKIQIMAAEALLERSRKACLPARISKDAMANKVRDVIADVLEEDPDTFGTGPYRPVVDQIISYLWPCEPIS